MPTHSTSHSRNPSTSTTMTTATAATTANTTLATGATDLQRKISYRKPAPSYYQPSTAEVVPPVPSNPNMSARARTPSYASSVSQEGVANLKRAASATPSLVPPRPPRSFERPVSPNAPPVRKVDQAMLDRESPLDVHVRDVQGRRDSFQLYAAPRRPTKLDKPQNTAHPAPETQPPVSVRPAKVVPHVKAVKPEPRLMPFPPPAKPVSFFELPTGSGSNSSLPSTNSHSYHYAKAAPSPSLVPSLAYQQVTRRPSFPPPVHFADPRVQQSRYERKGSPSGGREKFERVALDRHEPRAKVPRHSSSWASILCCVVPSIDMEDEPQSRRSSTQVQVRQSWGSSAGLLPGKGVRAAEVEVEDRWRGMGLPERRHPESYLGKKGSKHWQDDYSRQPRY